MENRTNFDDLDDPLVSAIRPPENETTEARKARLRAEAEALRISEEIDAQIAEEGRVQDWRKNAVKVILLGQAGSGKKTLLKSKQSGSGQWAGRIQGCSGG